MPFSLRRRDTEVIRYEKHDVYLLCSESAEGAGATGQAGHALVAYYRTWEDAQAAAAAHLGAHGERLPRSLWSGRVDVERATDGYYVRVLIPHALNTAPDVVGM